MQSRVYRQVLESSSLPKRLFTDSKSATAVIGKMRSESQQGGICLLDTGCCVLVDQSVDLLDPIRCIVDVALEAVHFFTKGRKLGTGASDSP